MQCEICGSAAADRKAEIEGAVLNVCGSCSKFGKGVTPQQQRAVKALRLPDEMQFALTENFSLTIKAARIKRQLSQEQLASAIKEKLSLVKRMEEGWNPPLQIARKVEKLLGIRIVESVQQESGNTHPVKSGVTIGDVAVMKRKARKI